MKALSIALTALFLLLTNASFAEAAPVFAPIATWFATAFTAASITATVTNILITSALSALATALLPKKKLGTGGITTDITLTGGDNPQSLIFGNYATAGSRAAPPMSFGFSGDGENEWIVDVVTLADMPIEAIEHVIIDGEKYNLQPWQSEGDYYEGRQFQAMSADGKLQNRAFVRFHDGTQTTADPILTAYFSNYPNRPWTARHIFTGTPYAILFYKYDAEKFAGFPETKFVVKGMRLYDPRKDSSVGGSGTHRFADQSTWEYTDNPIVQIYNVVRGINMPGGYTYGLKAKASALPLDKCFAAMNICDQRLPNGTRRYKSALEFTVDTEPLEVIDTLLAACGGSIAESGGIYTITAGAPALSVASFSDDDLIITENRDFDVFEGLQQTYNGVTASYPDPGALWETKEAVPYYNADWEREDDGRRLVADLRLSAVPYAQQVRRLMRELASDNRRTRKHSITLSPAFLGVNVLDTVTWTSQKNGYNNKLFEVISKTVDPYTLCVTFGIRERDPSDYDYNESFDDVTPVYPSPVVVSPVVVGVQGFDATDLLLRDAQGRSRRAAIQIIWSPTASYVGVSYQIRHATTGQGVASGTVSDVRAGAVIVSDGILPSTSYEVRARAIIRHRQTQWSGWLHVTTKAAAIVNDDFEGGIARLFRDQGLHAVEYLATLPTSGAFEGQLVFNTTDGKLYRWVTTPAPAKWVPVVESALQGVLDETNFAQGISIPRVVSALPTTGNFQGRMVTLSTDGKLYRYHNGAWTSSIPAVDVSGTLTSAQIATGAILSDKLANNAVSLAKLADGAVNSAKLLDGAVSELKIANNAVTSTAIAVGAITANTIAAGAITETKIANNAITTPKIAAAAVVANTIAAGAVTANSIAAGAVIAGKIAVGAVVANSIAANAVTAYAIAANTITSNEIAAGAITGAKIAANTITAVQISANTITAAEIAANTITSFEIAAGAITSEKIAAGAVEANSIAANAITSDKIESNAITSAKIAAGAIGAGQIAANAIVASKLAITDFTNLVPDDQMQDRDSWIVNAAGLPVVTHLPNQGTVTARSRGIFQVNPNGTNITQLVSKLSSAKPDNEYYFAGQFYSAATATVNLILQFLDVNTDVIGNKNIASTGTGWRIISDSVVAPTGTIYVRLVYQINASSYGGDIIYLAAPVIRAKTAGALIVDGTITGDKIVAQTITGGLLASAGIITNSAQINNAVITNAKIANLSVDRLKIADNAVSVQVSSTGNGNLTVAFNNPQTSTVTFGYFGKGYSTKTGNGGLVWYRGGGQLRMDNNIVDSTEMFNIEDSGYAQIGLIRQMTLAAGNHNAAFTTSYDMRAGLLFVIIQYK